jgi:CO dehydrogenase/acetyl-CoA synthase gamma subunit (corrinoid Fe-S protein)
MTEYDYFVSYSYTNTKDGVKEIAFGSINYKTPMAISSYIDFKRLVKAIEEMGFQNVVVLFYSLLGFWSSE